MMMSRSSAITAAMLACVGTAFLSAQGGPPAATIGFATYIGSDGQDSITSIETDASGAVYIAGGMPFDANGIWVPTYTSFGQGPAGSPQCYFARLVPDGGGGLTYDYVAVIRDGFGCGAMAVAPNGDVAIAGSASVLNSVVRLFSKPGGDLIQTASFAVPLQTVDHLRLDNSGRTYAVGLCGQELTTGSLWPLPNGAQPDPAPGLCTNPNAIGGMESQEALVVADSNGQITFGTFFGVDAAALDVTALEIDGSGRVWLAGHTIEGLADVTPDAFQPDPAGASDAFLAIIDPAQSAPSSLVYASYFGGPGVERDISMVLTPAGGVYLAGNTETLAGFPGSDFADPAIFLSVLDPSQLPQDQLLSTTAVVESPLTSLYGNVETTTGMRLLPNGSIAFLADSADSQFPLVQPLYSGPYDPANPNPLRPLLLVYDPAASAFTLATFLDDVQQARFPRVAADGSGTLYVGMTTDEAGRSTDGSTPLGQRDVLLVATVPDAGNEPPTVAILDPLFRTTRTIYADSPSGGTLQLMAIANDPDDDPLTYSWTGPFADSPVTTDSSLTARLPVGMQQTVTVTVDDGRGHTASASLTVDVIGTPFTGTTATPVDSQINGLVFNYAPVTVTAATVSVPGQMYLRSRLDQIPPPPDMWQAGSPPIYFDLSTDATLVAPIEVCIDAAGMSLADPQGIRLFQHRPSGQVAGWTEVTSVAFPDEGRVCGQSDALGTFAIFYPQVEATAVRTIAGNGVLQDSHDGPGGSPIDDFVDGPATSTALHYLFGGALDRASNRLFVSDARYIMQLDLGTNTISRVAGNGVWTPGLLDGPGGDLRDDVVEGGDAFTTYVGAPTAMVMSPAGDVVFYDPQTCRIRRLDLAQSRIFAVAGDGTCGFSGDGLTADLAAISVYAMAFDAAGNLFFTDQYNPRVRRIDALTNIIDTVAGDGSYATPIDGSAALSTIGTPSGLAFDAQGHLIVAAGMHLIRISTGAADALIDGDADEVISVLGGCNTNCQAPYNGDGLAISHPQVYLPGLGHVTAAQDGAVIFVDYFRIRRIAPGADGIVTGASDEIVSTVGGYYDWETLSLIPNFNGDTFSTQSRFSPAQFVVDDTQGRIVVVDGNNVRVRRFGLPPAIVAPLTIETPGVANADEGQPYSATITAAGGTGSGYGWSISAGALPAGLTLAATGTPATTLSGTPTEGGTFDFTVAVTDSSGNTASRAFTLVVAHAVVRINVAEPIVIIDAVALRPSAMVSVVEQIVVIDGPGVVPSVTEADLSVSVTATPTSVDVGQEVTFDVVLSNLGPRDAPSARLSVVLPPFDLNLVSLSAPGMACSLSAGLTCDLTNFAAGTTRTVQVVATAGAAGELTATFAVSTATNDPNPANDATTATVTAAAGADLSIFVSAPPTAVAGGILRYTVTVINNGPSLATGVTITMPVYAGFTLSNVNSPGGPCTFPVLGFPGSLTCFVNAPMLIRGEYVMTIDVVPTAVGSLSNTFRVTGTLHDPTPADNDMTVTVTITPGADLTVAAVPSSSLVAVGGSLDYAITVRNNGPATATAAGVTITADPGYVIDQITLPGLACTTLLFTRTWACGLGNIAAGATVQFSVIGRVTSSNPGTNTFAVGSTLPDPNPANNTVAMPFDARPTVTINQAAGQTDPAAVAPVNFTVVFSEPVTGLAAEDVSFAGSTVGGTLAASVAGSGASYTVSVTGMSGAGLVAVSIPAGAAVDSGGNPSAASTSTDRTVLYGLSTVLAYVSPGNGGNASLTLLKIGEQLSGILFYSRGTTWLAATRFTSLVINGQSATVDGFTTSNRLFTVTVRDGGPGQPETFRLWLDGVEQTAGGAISSGTVIVTPWAPDTRLRGWVDLHTHPMSNLAFGGKLFHGAPSVGSLMPAVQMPNDPECRFDERATSIAEALSQDGPTRGDVLQSRCGDSGRNLVIKAIEAFNGALTAPAGADGYPDFTHWPKWNDITHQKMWIDWIRRAWEGGQRVMVALSHHNRALTGLLGSGGPVSGVTNDRASSDLQIEEIKRLVADHSDFMAVATTPDQLHAIVQGGRLAIVLGVEIDRIGDFSTTVAPTEQAIDDEIERLYAQGVRYVLPIHFVDNAFGDAALHQDLYNLLNYHESQRFFTVGCAQLADGIGFQAAGLPPILAPFLLPGMPGLVAPACAFGHVNARLANGLTASGEFAIRAMMRRGMIVDIDHMSNRAANRTLAIANAVTGGGYPVTSGHAAVRDRTSPQFNAENSRTTAQLARIVCLGGMFGLGTDSAGGHRWAAQYEVGYNAMRRAFAPNGLCPGTTPLGAGFVSLGTDANSLVETPVPPMLDPVGPVRFADIYNPANPLNAGVAPLSRSTTGTKTWDYNFDGVAHYGMYVDFLRDVRTWNPVGPMPGRQIVDDQMMYGADYFYRMWLKADTQKVRVAASGTITP